MRCAIAIYPHLPGSRALEQLRQRFDPLAGTTPCHITLLAPFDLPLSSENMVAHALQIAATLEPFTVSTGPAFPRRNAVLVPISQGHQAIVQLRSRLCKGMLAPQRTIRPAFEPHITAGRTTTLEERRQCLAAAMRLPRLSGIIDQFSCDIIDSAGHIRSTTTLLLGQHPRPARRISTPTF